MTDRDDDPKVNRELTRGGPPRRRNRAIDPATNRPHPSDMADTPVEASLSERLSRVEGAIDGLRHSQNLTIGATGAIGALLAAFILAFGIYGLQRIDAVDNKIDAKFDALTARVSDESARTRQDLIGITTAIASAITAAKQPAAPQPKP